MEEGLEIYKFMYMADLLCTLKIAGFVVGLGGLFITWASIQLYRASEEDKEKGFWGDCVFWFGVVALAGFLTCIAAPNRETAIDLLKHACINMSAAKKGKILVDLKEYSDLREFHIKHKNCQEKNNAESSRGDQESSSKEQPDTTGHSVGTGEWYSHKH